MDATPITISEAARRLGKSGNRKLLQILIGRNGIPIHPIGTYKTLDAKGFARLQKAVKEWDSRPTLVSSKPKAATR